MEMLFLALGVIAVAAGLIVFDIWREQMGWTLFDDPPVAEEDPLDVDEPPH